MQKLLLLFTIFWSACVTTSKVPPPASNASIMSTTTNSPTETAIVGGGCFWCIEPLFLELKGVATVESGYSGGSVSHPTYKEVCSGLTGHAEVLQITFDPTVISYREILDIFFAVHDPTTLNRQGADVGTQYRSAIFYTNDQQKNDAEAAALAAGELWEKKIVTQIAPLDHF